MNRTAVFLSLAAGLGLLALVVGLPRAGGTTQVNPQNPPVTTVTLPQVPPTTSGDGAILMAGRLSHPFVAPGRTDLFVTVDLTGVTVAGAQRTPVNLAVVIDRSGSMSGQKLQQAKQAARHLVTLLRDDDRLSIVQFGSDVKVFGGLRADQANRQRMMDYIDGIWDDGGTNIGGSLDRARDLLATHVAEYKVNRLILLTDGQPTEGVTDAAELVREVKQIRAQGISLSAIGVGADFNEDLLQAFAEYGSGSYGFLESGAQLASLFQKDLQQASTTIARNVELSFELPAGVELGEVLGYRFTQAGRTVRVPLTDFSSGQVERVVARLTVDAASIGQPVDVSGLRLAYNDLVAGAPKSSSAQLSAMVTAKQEEVLSRRDKDANVYAYRALRAQNTQKAADAFAKGDRDGAQKLMKENEYFLDQAAQVAGPAAVAPDRAEQAEVYEGMSNASGAEEVQVQVKSAKVKALKSLGRMSSTY